MLLCNTNPSQGNSLLHSYDQIRGASSSIVVFELQLRKHLDGLLHDQLSCKCRITPEEGTIDGCFQLRKVADLTYTDAFSLLVMRGQPFSLRT